MHRPETPLLTVDIIIEMVDRPERPVVLIERKYEPFGWALPGGFVEIGETLEAAAVREAQEETGLHIKLTELLGAYSDPARDPRGHTVSLVYVATGEGEPEAADDAKSLRVVDPGALPRLVFDHERILEDYWRFRHIGRRPTVVQ